ncbi:hypothetical protein [Evansella halocellulosilytica]|uniref:hypothetical protein n=1 Tax=Evansella halocellulosilytica TaxID=2011013 RepID=UPI000BB93361|nr:hypothetical protein [Evansella halocellulosilytica]
MSTTKTINYRKFKRDRFGICNICLEKKPLSWDHVPPKNAVNITETEIYEIQEVLVKGIEGTKPHFSQNGLKFRTICSQCNSILGTEYDQEFGDLAKNVTNLMKSSLFLPESLTVTVNPYKVSKAIIGHLLSAKTHTDNNLIEKKLRSYFLSRDQESLDGLYIHYWVYPYNDTKILHDFWLKDIGDDSMSINGGSILKFFPLAFMIHDKSEYANLEEITSKIVSKEDTCQLPIFVRQNRGNDWPEAIKNKKVMLVGQGFNNSVFAKQRTKKK